MGKLHLSFLLSIHTHNNHSFGALVAVSALTAHTIVATFVTLTILANFLSSSYPFQFWQYLRCHKRDRIFLSPPKTISFVELLGHNFHFHTSELMATVHDTDIPPDSDSFRNATGDNGILHVHTIN
jgi:hypothetical protein